jgi:hypothetical protein
MPITLKNNARGYLAQELTASATEAVLGAGTGSSFPALTTGDFFYATLVSAAGDLEIVKVTARIDDTLTIERGAEDTTPQIFAPGSLVELRVTVGNIEAAATTTTQAVANTLFREYRPGDAPDLFTLTGGEVTSSTNGGVYRFTGLGRADMKTSVPLDVEQSYTFRVGYQRFKDSGDPANDGITAGVTWYNGFDNSLGETVIHSDNTLLVSSLHREFSYSIGFGGGPVYDVYAPSGARYAVPWFRTFGSDHQTDLDTLYLARTELPTPLVVSADEIVVPDDFQWPAGTIPAGAGVSDPYTVARTFYVTMEGSDANSGTSLRRRAKSDTSALSGPQRNNRVIFNPI